jgi:hypothetical protein
MPDAPVDPVTGQPDGSFGPMSSINGYSDLVVPAHLAYDFRRFLA